MRDPAKDVRRALRIAKDAGGYTQKPVSKNVDDTLGTNVPDVVFQGKQPHEWTPEQWRAFGEEHGVGSLGPANAAKWTRDLEPVKTLSGKTVTVPGGLHNPEPFSYYDTLHLKSQGIDPNDLHPETHQKIHDRMVAALQPGPAGPTPEHIANGMLFGMISPNQPLTPNELALQRIMIKGPKDLDRLSKMIPYRYTGDIADIKKRREYSSQISRALGLHAAKHGGIGASGSANYADIAEFAQKMQDRPDFFTFDPTRIPGDSPSEKWSNHVARVFNEIRGLKAKTGSLASVWQSPQDAAISAIDRHMATKLRNNLFESGPDQKDWENAVIAKFNASRPEKKPVGSIDELLATPGGRGHFVDHVLSHVNNLPAMMLRTKNGEYNPRVPEGLRNVPWVGQEPKKVKIIAGPYVRALDANREEAERSGQGLFSNQWMLWDRIRKRLEPHEIMNPALSRLPRMSLEQMRRVKQQHSKAGYNKASGAVNPLPNASSAGYFASGGNVIQNAVNVAKGIGRAIAPHPASTLPGIHLTAMPHPQDRVGLKDGGDPSIEHQPADETGFDAYHGSPHYIGEEGFQDRAIGTGEGAQAYGHGHYLAEHEPVARQYRDVLSGDPVTKEGEKPSWQSRGSRFLAKDALKEALGKGLTGDEAIRYATQTMHSNAGHASRYDIRQRYYDAINALGGMRGKEWSTNPGHMYHVRVHANPDHFLDWDKPLHEQSEHVRRALGWTPEDENQWRKAREAETDILYNELVNSENTQSQQSQSKLNQKIEYPARVQGRPDLTATGAVIAKGSSLFDRASDADRAKRLHAAGIPGIKYLDAGSRNPQTDEPTRNFVVFDPKRIQIKRRYARGGDVVDRALRVARAAGGRIGYAGGGRGNPADVMPVAAPDPTEVAAQTKRIAAQHKQAYRPAVKASRDIPLPPVRPPELMTASAPPTQQPVQTGTAAQQAVDTVGNVKDAYQMAGKDVFGMNRPAEGPAGKGDTGEQPTTKGSFGRLNSYSADVANRLAQHLMDNYGFSRDQAVGAVGVMGYESGHFQTMQEVGRSGTGSGWGYAQWTGPRRIDFDNYVKANGLDPSSYEANVQFLDHELNGPYAHSIDDMKKAQGVENSAKTWLHSFEGMSIDGKNVQGIPAVQEHVNSALSYDKIIPRNSGQTPLQMPEPASSPPAPTDNKVGSVDQPLSPDVVAQSAPPQPQPDQSAPQAGAPPPANPEDVQKAAAPPEEAGPEYKSGPDYPELYQQFAEAPAVQAGVAPPMAMYTPSDDDSGTENAKRGGYMHSLPPDVAHALEVLRKFMAERKRRDAGGQATGLPPGVTAQEANAMMGAGVPSNTLDEVLGTNNPTNQQIFGYVFPNEPPPAPMPIVPPGSSASSGNSPFTNTGGKTSGGGSTGGNMTPGWNQSYNTGQTNKTGQTPMDNPVSPYSGNKTPGSSGSGSGSSSGTQYVQNPTPAIQGYVGNYADMPASAVTASTDLPGVSGPVPVKRGGNVVNDAVRLARKIGKDR